MASSEQLKKLARTYWHYAFVAACGALAVAYAFPGYMNYDSSAQLAQARARIYDDWHPPIMAKYWHYVDLLVRGPLLLLLLQISLFLCGLVAFLGPRIGKRPAAVASGLILLFPPILVVMAVVWKDAQMTAFMVAGLGLTSQKPIGQRIAGWLMLCIAVALRDNAVAALLPLTIFIVRTYGCHSKLKTSCIAVLISATITFLAFATNRLITTRHAHAWYVSNAIHDIAGTLCKAERLSDDEVRFELAGVALRQTADLQRQFCDRYNPRWWFALSDATSGVFNAVPDENERAARKIAYGVVVRSHPGAFLRHRVAVFAAMVGLNEEAPDEPVCQSFAGTDVQAAKLNLNRDPTDFQRKLGGFFVWLARTALFRPWVYALLSLPLVVWAIRRRDVVVMAVIGSGTLYESGYALGAAGTPYRYSHYFVICVVVSGVYVACKWAAITPRPPA